MDLIAGFHVEIPNVYLLLSFQHNLVVLSLLQAFTGVLNLIELLGRYIPVFLYNNQVSQLF